ncbi:FIP1[III]-like protein [Actinidia eriantha]|uniref:FIP1[III]-like protein n=1 Tax=Actinidia eriantha TaxID=165200 RepID=UPI00258D228B|nr:FIP1[III]-like protein [Actinidia eriantha]
MEMDDIDDDDDFGDLYADVEFQASTTIHGVSNLGRLCIEQDDNGTKCVDEVIQDDEPKRETNCGENGSDSEDDLNIVLNDDGGGGGFGGVDLRSGGFDEEEEEDDGFEIGAEGEGLGKNRNWVDQSLVGDGLEPSASGGGERGNGSKGSYQSQFLQYKYIRPHGTSFPTVKSNGFARVSLYSSTSVKGDRDDHKCNQHMASSSLAAQSGHNFSLPRYRTILDVNIDAFEQRPWRHPRADITDFFNFGFDEENWKLYCKSVEQLRQQTYLLNRTPVYDFSKPKEVYEAGTEYEERAHKAVPEKVAHNGQQEAVSPVSRITHRGAKKFEKPKGRVIQVEDYMLERQPSMNVKRSIDRDPDVVIQIAVQDCMDDSCSSGKEESSHKGSTHEASDGDFNVDDDNVIHHFDSGSGDELSRKFKDGKVKRSGRPFPKRCSQQTMSPNLVSVDLDNHGSGQISHVDEHCSQKITGTSSEGNTEAPETSNKSKEKVCRDICNTVPSMEETESLLGDQTQYDRSLSYSGGHCEASGDGASTDTERFQNHVRRQSTNSVSELRESVTSDYYNSHNSKSHHDRRITCGGKYYARNRRSMPDNLKHYSRRLHNNSGLNRHHNYDLSPFCNTDNAYYSSVGHGRLDRRSHGFDSYDGEDFSFYKESELSFKYVGERVPYNEVQSTYSKKPDRSRHSFGDETDRYLSRRWDEGEYFLEQRVSRVDEEVTGRDWNHYERELTFNPLIRKESRRLVSGCSSYLDKERATQLRRKGDEFQFRKRTKKDDFLLDCQYQLDFRQENYGYRGKEREYLDGKYDRHLPFTRRGERSSGRNDRKCDSPAADLDNLWAMSNEDDYWRCADHQYLSSYSWREPRTSIRGRAFETISQRNLYDPRLTQRHERNTRLISKESNRASDWFGCNHDAGDTKERVNFGRRRHWQSESLRWTEDEYAYRHENEKFLAEEESFSFGRTSSHRRVGAKQKLIDGVELEQHRIKLTREGSSSNHIERRSNIIHREYHGKPRLRCKDSDDLHLVVGEGKSSRRCSNAGSIMCKDKPENRDQNIDKEQIVSVDYNVSHAEMAGQADNSTVEIDQNEEKWLDKFPVTQHNKALDIEEGQIITEEVSLNPAAENFGSENIAEIVDERKKSLVVHEHAAKENKVVEDYDSPRILEVMAKMEKRRNRFKEPIALKKETDRIPNPQDDPVLETIAEPTQQRPARKRRWGGS